MSDSLFRPEALDASKGKLIGTVALYSPPYIAGCSSLSWR